MILLTIHEDALWQIIETRFPPKNNPLAETLFTVGNGYIGLRGTFEEGYSDTSLSSVNGSFLNGFFDSVPIHYAENAYGFARNHQVMLNVPDGKGFQFSVGGENFNLFQGQLHLYRRVLDMKRGCLIRDVVWESPSGRKVSYQSTRFACFRRKNLAAHHVKITPMNGDMNIICHSYLNGDIHNQQASDDPRVGSHFHEQPLMAVDSFHEGYMGVIVQKTRNTRFLLVSAMDHLLASTSEIRHRIHQKGLILTSGFEASIKKGDSLTLTKIMCYCTSRDFEEPTVLDHMKVITQKAKKDGLDVLLQEQEGFLRHYWSLSDIEVQADPMTQQGIRFNQFHLIQSTGRDGKTNIAAKGLTGEGYGGHYFWDTEIYMLPYYLYTHPNIARSLLKYRISILDQAKIRAREMGHSIGALYPWRTITGEECSAYFPAGTAQYHINADIAYALKSYMEATDDIKLLVDEGASEMLFETARIWVSLGHFSEVKGGLFCIDCVTGPDEYTALVNNNLYTNLMAQMHLQYAYDVYIWMEKHFPDILKRIGQAIHLDSHEPLLWKKASEKMYIPYDHQQQIHPQDDHFLDKKKWDFKTIPQSHYPLLLHYHPLVIYRHQVLKQPDVLLAQYLLGHRFSIDQKKRAFDYYEPLTTHDSSLSSCIHSIMASEIGYIEKAMDYFQKTLRIDIDDLHGNTRDGIHAAAMAGSWMTIVNGFAGMRIIDGHLSFAPMLPDRWKSYGFRVVFRGRLVCIDISEKGAGYGLASGKPLTIHHHGKPIEIHSEGEKRLDL